MLSHRPVIETVGCDCRSNLVTITELLESIRKLQDISDSKKYEMIAQVLDEDHDGVLDTADVMQVIMLCIICNNASVTKQYNLVLVKRR